MASCSVGFIPSAPHGLASLLLAREYSETRLKIVATCTEPVRFRDNVVLLSAKRLSLMSFGCRLKSFGLFVRTFYDEMCFGFGPLTEARPSLCSNPQRLPKTLSTMGALLRTARFNFLGALLFGGYQRECIIRGNNCKASTAGTSFSTTPVLGVFASSSFSCTGAGHGSAPNHSAENAPKP